MMRSFLFLFSLSFSIIYPGNEPILKLFSIFADFNFADRLIFNLKATFDDIDPRFEYACKKF